jgi:hypothetical protein
MVRLFTDRMAGAHEAIVERQHLDFRSTLLKSYVLEAHMPTNDLSPHEWTAQVLAESAINEEQGLEVAPTEEEGLFSITAVVRGASIELLVDASSDRFWFVHSLSESTGVDQVLGTMIRSTPEFDRTWFSADFLERVTELGSFRGLGLDYDRRALGDLDPDEDGTGPVEFLKMQLWGTRARDVLQKLQEEDAFPSETSLSKVRLHYSGPGDETAYSLDDVKWDGKTTARGTSFDSHNDLLTTITRSYAGQIGHVEESFRLVPGEDGRQFSGAPVHFQFARPIENVERFCAALFRSREPFRLWGAPARSTGETTFRVHAVDLHVGRPLDIEVSANFMRVYLPGGGCGNSLLRLYANLQHYFDAKVRAIDSNGEDAFAFQP